MKIHLAMEPARKAITIIRWICSSRKKAWSVFVDDTGHDALVEGHPVYGLGGCAIMAADLDRVVRHPWHEVRRKVTGSPDTKLHASSFGRMATPEQIGIVADFFRRQ